MIALLLAATVHFTLPAFHADSLCVGSTTPCTLGWARLYGLARYASWPPVLLASKDVSGREGRPDSLTFEDGGQVWSLLARTVSNGGAESCDSNWITLNGTTAVADQTRGFAFSAPAYPCSMVAPFSWVAPPGRLELMVIDVAGAQAVRAIFQAGGPGRYVWNCSEAPMGVYFARLRQGSRQAVKRFVVIR